MNEGTLDKTKRETDQLHIIPAGHCWLECSRACVVWNNRTDRFYQRSGKGCVTGLKDFSRSISKQWCVWTERYLHLPSLPSLASTSQSLNFPLTCTS